MLIFVGGAFCKNEPCSVMVIDGLLKSAALALQRLHRHPRRRVVQHPRQGLGHPLHEIRLNGRRRRRCGFRFAAVGGRSSRIFLLRPGVRPRIRPIAPQTQLFHRRRAFLPAFTALRGRRHFARKCGFGHIPHVELLPLLIPVFFGGKIRVERVNVIR